MFVHSVFAFIFQVGDAAMIRISDPFRIMSFNIRNDNPHDLSNGWQYRKERAASMIRFHRVDLCGLQEVVEHQLHDLLNMLPEFAYIGVGRDDGAAAGEYSPILYRKDRFTPVGHGTFWLSETPDVKGSRGWDAVCRRIVTWAKLEDKRTGSKLVHFNTHFDHQGENARIQSALLLKGRMGNIAGGDPIVATGDFNCTEQSMPYAILTGPDAPSLYDARKLSLQPHHGPSITFHAFRGNEYVHRLIGEDKPSYQWHGEDMFSLIDFILISERMTVLQEGVLADHWDGGYPSDHSPVVADLEID